MEKQKGYLTGVLETVVFEASQEGEEAKEEPAEEKPYNPLDDSSEEEVVKEEPILKVTEFEILQVKIRLIDNQCACFPLGSIKL